MDYNISLGPMGPISWDIETTQGKDKPMESKFYIIWEPTSAYPPTRRFTGKRAAEIVAEKMAKDNSGKAFYVLEASAYFQVDNVVRRNLG